MIWLSMICRVLAYIERIQPLNWTLKRQLKMNYINEKKCHKDYDMRWNIIWIRDKIVCGDKTISSG